MSAQVLASLPRTCLTCLLIGVLLLLLGAARILAQNHKWRLWPETSGTITDIDVSHDTSRQTRPVGTRMLARHVTTTTYHYRYTVREQSFEAQQTCQTFTAAGEDRWAPPPAPFQKGESVAVHYNPSRPTDSWIIREPVRLPLLPIALGLLMIAIGGICKAMS